MLTYERKLQADLNWAFREGNMHFDEKSEVHTTLQRITARSGALGIAYAVVGGMAMFAHGFRRFTEHVDLLVTREGMQRIVAELEGLGYVRPAGTSTKLHDTQSGVRIESLITGGFPGDGKPKPVAFPDPTAVSVTIDGVQYVGLPTLVELKLASGMTGGVNRLKDLADVVELIRTLSLPEDFARTLNEYVRDKFIELWRGSRESPDVVG
jgi:hypothetical protein